ncbi:MULTISPECIES: hypothetical protein [Mesorhizobium]|uniref:hypothetical protein n=1 Tax=Mesorhizobium TaxID=68287 RepID=UPI0003CDDD6A|nr:MULTISPECIES: hypothetical protein [Mesorhizobium]ESY64767.1 hypothetical protein X742_25060 [Mesorhizobium sp. LNHC232B00]WJI40542.1 hypothetical protein NL534_09970 [Mesorhizobium opportunistum]
MATKTDPAREIADICKRLAKPSEQPGDRHLAAIFGVNQWSRDFYEIVFSISDRLELLSKIVAELDLDEDQRIEISEHIAKVNSAFGRGSLLNAWNSQGTGASILRGPHAAAISVLSGQVRARISYPKLDDAEAKEIIELIDTLLSWLYDIQLGEQDFIRQALIDGLQRCRTRMDRLNWLGWGYTVESLREVIGAYLALERGFPEPQDNTSAAAILKKTWTVLKVISDKIGMAGDVRDKGQFLIEMYGWCAVARDSGIAGLIASALAK